MTHKQYKKTLLQEIQRINNAIDLKVVFGEHYRDEARRHKMLLEQAERLKKDEFWSKARRVLNFVTLF